MSQTGNGVLDKTKDLCVGCRDDYYNGKNEKGIQECWLYERARLVKRFKIGWWTQPTSASSFEEVWTLNCHNAPGQYALMEELPDHVRRRAESGTPRIVTMGQDSACKYTPGVRAIAISIRSPGSPCPTLHPSFRAVLFLEFEDDGFEGWETRDRGMTPQQGLLVADFIRANEGLFDTLLIHCFVGVSRSVSMAIALSLEKIGEYVETPGRIPNRNVYVTTRRAFAKAPEPAEAAT